MAGAALTTSRVSSTGIVPPLFLTKTTYSVFSCRPRRPRRNRISVLIALTSANSTVFGLCQNQTKQSFAMSLSLVTVTSPISMPGATPTRSIAAMISITHP
jgi:hypothetical protein